MASRFLKGEWVTCIDNDLASGDGLTKGRDYEVLRDDNGATLVFIKDDAGEENFYNYKRFQASLNAHKVSVPMFVARMQVLKVTKKLSLPDEDIKIEWIETGIGYLIFRLVSNLFTNVPSLRRHAVFDEALATHAPKVVGEYEIIYEAVTPMETKLSLGEYY